MSNHFKSKLSNGVSHRTNPLFLPCKNCGSKTRKVGVGKAPGQSSLLCDCGKFIKWIWAWEVAIADQLNNGGQR